MGGYVTFAVLRSGPQVVRAVVLADTRAGADNSEGRENRRRCSRTSTAKARPASLAR